MLRYILRYIFLSVFAVLLIRFFAIPACGEIGLVSENVLQLKSSGECTFCDLGGANLTNATLNGAYLYGADLTDANLDGASLDRVIHADFTGALNVPAKYWKN